MSTRRPKTITIAIWCPSLNPVGSIHLGLLTRINKFAGREQCILTIKVALQTPLVFVHDQKGYAINDFSLLEDGTVVVVTTDYFEAPKDMWTKELQEGRQTAAWMTLTRTQRRVYMQDLSCRCCNVRHTKVVLTLPTHLIRSSIAELLAQGLPSLSLTPDPPSTATHAATIQESWGRTIDEFMGLVGFVKPEGAMQSWDPALIPILALLADATAGQVGLVHEATVWVIKRRSIASGSMAVTTADLHQVIGGFIGGDRVYLEDTDGEEEKDGETQDGEYEDDEYGDADISGFDWFDL